MLVPVQPDIARLQLEICSLGVEKPVFDEIWIAVLVIRVVFPRQTPLQSLMSVLSESLSNALPNELLSSMASPVRWVPIAIALENPVQSLTCTASVLVASASLMSVLSSILIARLEVPTLPENPVQSFIASP